MNRGSPALIPGAFEIRARPPAGPTIQGPAALVAHRAHAPAAASDHARLEHEREGGGAPSARRGRRPGTMVDRLWRSMLHPTQLQDIWRRRLAQAD
jgi:hypothetical protein